MQFTTLSISALLFAVSLAAPNVHRRQSCSEAEMDASWNVRQPFLTVVPLCALSPTYLLPHPPTPFRIVLSSSMST